MYLRPERPLRKKQIVIRSSSSFCAEFIIANALAIFTSAAWASLAALVAAAEAPTWALSWSLFF